MKPNNTLSKRLEALLRYGFLRIYDTPEQFKASNKDYPFEIEGWDETKTIYHFKPYPEYEDYSTCGFDIWEVIQVKPKGQINDFTYIAYDKDTM